MHASKTLLVILGVLVLVVAGIVIGYQYNNSNSNLTISADTTTPASTTTTTSAPTPIVSVTTPPTGTQSGTWKVTKCRVLRVANMPNPSKPGLLFGDNAIGLGPAEWTVTEPDQSDAAKTKTKVYWVSKWSDDKTNFVSYGDGKTIKMGYDTVALLEISKDPQICGTKKMLVAAILGENMADMAAAMLSRVNQKFDIEQYQLVSNGNYGWTGFGSKKINNIGTRDHTKFVSQAQGIALPGGFSIPLEWQLFQQ